MGRLPDALQLGAEFARRPEQLIMASKPFGPGKCPVFFQWILMVDGRASLVGTHIERVSKERWAMFFNILLPVQPCHKPISRWPVFIF